VDLLAHAWMHPATLHSVDPLTYAMKRPATLPSHPVHIMLARVRVRPATPQLVDLLVATVRIRLGVPLLVAQTRNRILYLVKRPTPVRVRSLRVGTLLDTRRAKVRSTMVIVPKVPVALQYSVFHAVAGILVVITLCSLTDGSMNTGSGAANDICWMR